MAIDEKNGAVDDNRDIERLPAWGVWSPALTPVDDDLAPDAGRFVSHARWLLETGCHGVVVFGTTGEAPSFSTDERVAVLDAALAAGLPPERLIVGTGCAALSDTVRLTRHAADSGCAGVLVVPPFYFKGPPEDGVFRSFAEIIERAGGDRLRLYLYHFPRLSGVPITIPLIERLIDRFPGVIAGVKDSSGDWDNTKAMLARFPELAIFPGSETFLLPALERGGAGCITATANVNARAIRAVFDAWREGRAEAGALQEGITEMRQIIEQQPLAPALKYLAARYRDDPAWRRVRPPMAALGDDAGEDLAAAIAAQGGVAL